MSCRLQNVGVVIPEGAPTPANSNVVLNPATMPVFGLPVILSYTTPIEVTDAVTERGLCIRNDGSLSTQCVAVTADVSPMTHVFTLHQPPQQVDATNSKFQLQSNHNGKYFTYANDVPPSQLAADTPILQYIIASSDVPDSSVLFEFVSTPGSAPTLVMHVLAPPDTQAASYTIVQNATAFVISLVDTRTIASNPTVKKNCGSQACRENPELVRNTPIGKIVCSRKSSFWSQYGPLIGALIIVAVIVIFAIVAGVLLHKSSKKHKAALQAYREPFFE